WQSLSYKPMHSLVAIGHRLAVRKETHPSFGKLLSSRFSQHIKVFVTPRPDCDLSPRAASGRLQRDTPLNLGLRGSVVLDLNANAGQRLVAVVPHANAKGPLPAAE